MENQKENNQTPILVEFSVGPHLEQTSILGLFDNKKEDFKEKSKNALNDAMDAIKEMASRIGDLKQSIPVEFSKVEVGFGIKCDMEAGVVLAKMGMEGNINVKLTWERKEKDSE